MRQQGSSSAVDDRLVPTRPAAIVLLLLDTVLLFTSLFVRLQSWFVFAYIPLLFTVAWGVMLGRVWKWPAIMLFGAVLLAIVALGVTLLWPGGGINRLRYALIGGQVVLAFVGFVVIGLAIRGWVKFFHSRTADVNGK